MKRTTKENPHFTAFVGASYFTRRFTSKAYKRLTSPGAIHMLCRVNMLWGRWTFYVHMFFISGWLLKICAKNSPSDTFLYLFGEFENLIWTTVVLLSIFFFLRKIELGYPVSVENMHNERKKTCSGVGIKWRKPQKRTKS